MTELNKFGVIGLLNFHKGLLSSHVVKFPSQKPQYIYKDTFYCIKEKYRYTDEKESVLFLHTKISTLLSLIIGKWGERENY